MKATVHLIKDDNEYDTDDITIEILDAKYPGLRESIKRGDIIENISQSGYRSDGVNMYDGEKVIDQNYEWDDYGSPSTKFKVITEFPPTYWDARLGIKNSLPTINWEKDSTSSFYWHSDSPPLAVDVVKLGLRDIVNKAIEVSYNDQIYIIIPRDLEHFKKTIHNEDVTCLYWVDDHFIDEY